MSLRNQPYLPLYVKDFRSDEKLARCSASSHGVYILLMCILHGEAEYGKFLLKQKDKQNSKQNDKQNESSIKNFASILQRMMPFDVSEIEEALMELLDNDVIQIDGDCLCQKRMVRDAKLSEIRASAGKKGGSKPRQNLPQNGNSQDGFCFSKNDSKNEANTAIVIAIENEYETNGNSTDRSSKREGTAVSFYLDKINPTASEISLRELDEFEKDLGAAVCIRAMQIAIDAKSTAWNYIRGILRDKQSKGIRSLEAFVADEEKFESQKKRNASAKKPGTSPPGEDVEWIKKYIRQRETEGNHGD